MLGLEITSPRSEGGVIKDVVQIGGLAIETTGLVKLASNVLRASSPNNILRTTIEGVVTATSYVAGAAVDMYFGDFPSVAIGSVREQ